MHVKGLIIIGLTLLVAKATTSTMVCATFHLIVNLKSPY
jgi:hypothetical protein